MLPDLSPTHILIVVVVALVVVGPKDLPMLLRKIGQFMAKMRGMANEFRASFDEMARQSELDELRKEVEAMRSATQAAIPHDPISDPAPSQDAEGAYMHQWQASQADAEPYLPGLPDAHSILPPTTVEAPPAAEPTAPDADGKTHALAAEAASKAAGDAGA